MKKQITSHDALAELGALALGSRLRRLSERLYREAATSLRAEGIDLAPNHIPVLMTLLQEDRLHVSDLTDRLGASQPGITRMISHLKDKGLVTLEKPARDQRQTLISLSGAGAELAAALEGDYCKRVARAAEALYETAAPDFLESLAAIEAALEEKSLSDRIAVGRE